MEVLISTVVMKKTEGAKIYVIAKDICKRNPTVFCPQGKYLLTLYSDGKVKLHQSGYQDESEAGVGIPVRVYPELNTLDSTAARVVRMDTKVHGFNICLVNCSASTDANKTVSQKQVSISELSERLVKTQKNQNLAVMGDYNALTNNAGQQSFFRCQNNC